MVTYQLIKREGEILTYAYWPEEDRSARRGLFVVDLGDEKSRLVEPAERDFKCRTTGAEMNAMRDDINCMREEQGKPPLTEEELPVVPSNYISEWWRYYDHALRDLSRRHDAGEIPEEGTAMWY